MYSGKSPRTKSTSANSSNRIMAGLLQMTLAGGAEQPAYQGGSWQRGTRWRSAEIACANAVFSSQAGENACGGQWDGLDNLCGLVAAKANVSLIRPGGSPRHRTPNGCSSPRPGVRKRLTRPVPERFRPSRRVLG